MAAITVGTTPVLLIPVKAIRKNVTLQNEGTQNVFIKRWPPGTLAPIPSATNYDLILYARPAEGTEGDWIFQTESISAFVGVVGTGTTTVGVMETVKVIL